MLARIRSFRDSDTTGSTLVEMALSLPIMLTVLMGIFTFSIALYQKLELAEAISTGGRVLATARGQSDPCGMATSAINAAAPTLKSSSISLTYTLNGVTTSGTSCSAGVGVSNANMILGGNAKVVATYPCVIAAYKFVFPSCTLTSGVTEVVQ
jgi:Flp pilus assembly protein TadG